MMRLFDRRGESLIETLIAMLIVSLVMLGLSGAITSAAKINHDTERAMRSCTMSKDTQTDVITATVRWGGESRPVSITQYEDDGYYFYEKTP